MQTTGYEHDYATEFEVFTWDFHFAFKNQGYCTPSCLSSIVCKYCPTSIVIPIW
jgi:hypothetical protein